MEVLDYIVRNRLAGYILADVRRVSMSVMVGNKRKLEIFKEIKVMLEKEGIRVIALKGIAMMVAYYDDISQRPIGDLDILIEERDIYRAREILLENGAEEIKHEVGDYFEEDRAHLNAMVYKSVMIELHRDIFREGDSFRPNEDIFKHICEVDGIKMFDEEMMLYHISTHAYEHMRIMSIPMIWVVDIAKIIERLSLESVEKVLSFNRKNAGIILLIFSFALKMVSEEKRKEIEGRFGIKARDFKESEEYHKKLGVRMMKISDKFKLLNGTVRRKGLRGTIENFHKTRLEVSEKKGKSLMRTYIDYFIHFR